MKAKPNGSKTLWGNTVLRQCSAHLKELSKEISTEFAIKKWPVTLETDACRVIK